MIKIYSPIQKYPNWWPSSHRLRNQPNWCYLGTSLEYISPRVLPFLLDQLEPKRVLWPLLVKLRHQLYLARVWLGSTLAVHLGVPVLPAVAKVWGDGLSLQQQHTNKQNAPKTKQKKTLFIYSWKTEKILGSESVILPRSLDQTGQGRPGSKHRDQCRLPYSRAPPGART